MTVLESGTLPAEEPKEALITFDQLGLSPALLRAVTAKGYTQPTPIQAQSIPAALSGQDILGIAQTGTGKTAAFALPILERLGNGGERFRRPIRALVLAPTRELASQIRDSFQNYGRQSKLTSFAIYGGVKQDPQTRALRQGVDVLIATPGRLLDLVNQGHIKLNRVEALVLDEADRMFDMGFINDLQKIVALLPGERQTLLYSATMPPAIQELADTILNQPAIIEMARSTPPTDRIEQTVYLIDRGEKADTLRGIIEEHKVDRAIVFSRTKHGADKIARQLAKTGITAEAIHGDKSQNQREQALARFRRRSTRVLVATDVASRGLDIDAVTHVFNYDLPVDAETYVHRIGRTARAGASGIAISFCAVEEKSQLFAIQQLLKTTIPVFRDGVRDEAGVFPVRRVEGMNGPRKRAANRSASNRTGNARPFGRHGNRSGSTTRKPSATPSA